METQSNVKIIGLSNTDEKLSAAGGRISTQPGNAMDIWERSQDDEKNAKLIQLVTKSGHTSVIEHTTYHLLFKDVSAIVEQFMIEFRLASFTVKSRRYVDFANVGYYIPHFDNEDDKKIYTDFIDSLFADYEVLIGKGIPKEDARFILPYAFYSNFICSVNARELLHILEAMLYGRGKNYPEIYNIGEAILKQIEELTPGIAATFHQMKKKGKDTIDLSFMPETIAGKKQKDKVEFLSHTENPEKAILISTLAMHDPYSLENIDTLLKNKDFIKQLITEAVTSSRPRALESAQFTFALNGITLSTLTHIARHRMQSLFIPQFTSLDHQEYVIPKTIEDNGEALKIYNDAFKKAYDIYRYFSDNNLSIYNLTYLLLSGHAIDITLSMNARELLLFFKLRTCERAQWEIVDYATEMLMMLRKEYPTIFSHFGPSCYVLGYCPEGKLTCGNIKEVKKKFQMD